MKLPNLQNLIIERSKIVDYLLSDTHEDGRHKAAFFRRFGFLPELWQELADALKRHALDHGLAADEPSPFGHRYLAEGIIHTPDGRTPLVRTIWFVRTNDPATRFVTAYPLKQREVEQEHDERT
jgi:hypothetical protein